MSNKTMEKLHGAPVYIANSRDSLGQEKIQADNLIHDRS